MSYTQLKISVDPQLAAAFKSACIASGRSMASVLAHFMADFARSETSTPNADLHTKRQRRAEIQNIIKRLRRVRDSQQRSLDRIPVNLHSAPAFDSAESWISSLDEAIDSLLDLL
jgi:hypothetical protein